MWGWVCHSNCVSLAIRIYQQETAGKQILRTPIKAYDNIEDFCHTLFLSLLPLGIKLIIHHLFVEQLQKLFCWIRIFLGWDKIQHKFEAVSPGTLQVSKEGMARVACGPVLNKHLTTLQEECKNKRQVQFCCLWHCYI